MNDLFSSQQETCVSCSLYDWCRNFPFSSSNSSMKLFLSIWRALIRLWIHLQWRVKLTSWWWAYFFTQNRVERGKKRRGNSLQRWFWRFLLDLSSEQQFDLEFLEVFYLEFVASDLFRQRCPSSPRPVYFAFDRDELSMLSLRHSVRQVNETPGHGEREREREEENELKALDE